MIRLGTFLFAIATFLGIAHLYGFSHVAGQAHWVLHDDFMIAQRYAQHLAAGDGLVFNSGERIEGFSDPLTVLAISWPLEWLRVPGRMLGLCVWSLNALLHGLIALTLLGSAPDRRRGGLCALAYVTLPHHSFFAHCGLEVYVQALLLLLVVSRLREGGRVFYVALGLLPLAHSIDLPLWSLASIARFSLARDRGREAFRLALSALPMALYETFRLAYYGQPLPNTYYLKAGGVSAPIMGVLYLLRGGKWLVPLLALALVGLWREKQRLRGAMPLLAFILIPYFVFVAKVGGDNFEWYRFIFIALPAVLWAIRESCAREKAWLVTAAIAAQLAINVVGFVRSDEDNRRLLRWDAGRIALGYAIAANSRADAVVALFGIGNAGYFSDRYVLDMLGKADAFIARTPAHRQRRIGHQKDDPAYVMSRRPDLVEMGAPESAAQERGDLEALERMQRTRFGYFADLALEPAFRRDYRPVLSQAGPLPLYVRRDIPPVRWTAPPEAVAE